MRVKAVALFTLVGIIYLSQPGWAEVSITAIFCDQVRLDLVVGHNDHLVSENRARIVIKRSLRGQGQKPEDFGYRVMTGLYFDPRTKGIGGLYIRDGKVQCPATKHHNRPVLMQLRDGTLLVTTTGRALWYQKRIRVAIEIGPFLIDANGNDWTDYSDIRDPKFFRPTRRLALGLTSDCRVLLVRGFGTLGQIRTAVRARYPTVRALVNLDGGSSAVPGASLPSRLVAFWKKQSAALTRRD